MGKIQRPEIKIAMKKGYDIGLYQLYQFNNRNIVIATSLEEAITIYREYQEKQSEDPYRGEIIKEIELIDRKPISKKYSESMNEL
jgi:hypothetical protein